MAKVHIYLSCNSKEVRDELREKGFDLCKCCEFEDSQWLSYLDTNDTVHGMGYPCENDCDNKKCLQCCLFDSIRNNTTIVCKTVDEFIQYINKLRSNGTEGQPEDGKLED